MMQAEEERYVVGVISDTHGLVRASALDALRGVDVIVHAGDIGGTQVVVALEEIAPVRLVRGNTDVEAWSRTLPETDVVEVGEHKILVVHDLGTLGLDPEAAGVSVVVSGHSHKPRQVVQRGVLYFNPGSAGPRRFHLPIGVGRLVLQGRQVRGELVRLEA
jgi:putative phosphoesterase